jgi:hypothetical protein
MILSLVRVSSKIIKVSFDYVLKIMKHEIHGMLKGFSDIFMAERHIPVCKSSPRKNKCRLVLILRFNLNLIISLKSFHERKYFSSHTLIENLIDERCGGVLSDKPCLGHRNPYIHRWFLASYLREKSWIPILLKELGR